MTMVNLTKDRIDAINEALTTLTEEHSNYMTLSDVLKYLLPLLKNTEEKIGSDKIELIYETFCNIFPEFTEELTKQRFKLLFDKRVKKANTNTTFQKDIYKNNLNENESKNDNNLFNSSSLVDNNYLEDKSLIFNELTDEQWFAIKKDIDSNSLSFNTKRKKIYRDREILTGILWVILNEKSWRSIPKYFPSHPTLNRYYHTWRDNGILKRVYAILKIFYDEKVLEPLMHMIK